MGEAYVSPIYLNIMKYSIGDKIKIDPTGTPLDRYVFKVKDIINGEYVLAASTEKEHVANFTVKIELVDRDFGLTMAGIFGKL